MNGLNNIEQMDDNNNSQFLAFDAPLNQSSFIKVVGVGGGGNNAVNHMYSRGIVGVDFIVCNTDMKALNTSPVPNKLALGHSGMGAGNDPAKARRAAESKEQEIKELFEHNTKMVFITAGMGGGTGTGAAPVIARIAKDIKIQDDDMEEDGKILVVAVVTTPFLFEGRVRLKQALAGVEELRKYVDAILVIDNEKLHSFGDLVLSEAFAKANDVLLTAVKGIAEIITLSAYVNIDFRDVNTVMQNSGTALMGIGEGEGENRALQAVEAAASSPLLDANDIAGAKNVLLYFSYGPDHEIKMNEMTDITDFVSEKTGSDNIIWGTGVDESLGDKVKITLIATGFSEPELNREGKKIEMKPDNPEDHKPATPAVDAGEPHIVSSNSRRNEGGFTGQPVDVAANTVEQRMQDSPVAPTIERVQPISAPIEETPSKPRIIQLDDEPKTMERVSQQPADDGLRIVSRQSVVEPASQPAERTEPTPSPNQDSVWEPVANTQQQHYGQPTPQSTTDMMEKMTMSRADRIRMMHDLLRNDVNGASIVEKMDPMELTGEKLYQAVHSSESSVQSHGVAADGTVKPNSFVFNSVD